jgi:hypothetical protein
MKLAWPAARTAGRTCLLGLVVAAYGCNELPTEVSPTVEPQMAATMAANATIDVKVVRFTGGTGSVLVSSGIPLARGLLNPGQSGQVRLLVNGVEQSVHVKELKGFHVDGSLRSILLQFKYAVPTGGMSAQLVIGQSRTKPDLALGPATYPYGKPLPAAAALPSSPGYLLSTEIVGKATLAPDGFSPRYESNFYSYGDPKWSTFISMYGSSITMSSAKDLNYYDRAYIYYAWWVRTGNPEYWRRAAYMETAYRDKYLKASGYNVQPHDLQIDGVEAHYLLTGDPASLTAVTKLAHLYFNLWMSHIGSLSSKYNANRIQARVLDTYMTAARLDIRQHDYQAASRKALTLILGTQRSDGSYRFKSSCQQQLNYQTGLLNDALVEYYEVITPDSRIPTSIRRSLDFLWNTQWLAAGGGFKYISGYCSTQGTTKAAPDLNMLIVSPFGWYAKHSGLSGYRTKGDQVFIEGVKRAWLVGEKHFNENYRASYRYLFYRR